MNFTKIGGASAWRSLGQNIQKATQAMESSVSRLSSGHRLVRASDDVASLSIATRLSTTVTSLKQAGVNMAQADSFTQVIDGALQQSESLLQRMKALAVQASSGALMPAERSFLDQEFQQLALEVNRIAEQTSFGNIYPLNNEGLKESIYVDDVITDEAQADGYSATLIFNNNWTGDARWISLGTFDTAPNERFYWRNNTTLGVPAFNFQNSSPSLNAKLQNMVNRWNDPNGPIQQDERFSRVGMERIGSNQVRIYSRSRGDMAQMFAIGDLNAHADVRNAMQVFGQEFQHNATSTFFNYVLQPDGMGSATGLGIGSVTAAGSSGNALIAPIQQQPGEIRLRMTGNFVNNQQLRIDDGLTGLNNFVFLNNPVNPSLHIQIGSNRVETLDNAVTFFNNWVELQKNTANYATWYSVAHLEFSREGNDLVIRSTIPGKPVDLFGTDFNLRETLTNGTLVNGVATGNNLNMVGGIDTGINASGVSNKDFVGTVQGFEGQFISSNRAAVSVKVGEATYRAVIQDTNIPSNQRVRFLSEGHGYFDVDLQAGNGMPVSNQKEAEEFAKLFEVAFAGTTFYQERAITNFQPPASSFLFATRLLLRDNDFPKPIFIEDFHVLSKNANGGNAELQMTINGEKFRSVQLIDHGIRPTASVKMVSLSDSKRIVTFDNLSSTAFDLDTVDQAAQFEAEMRKYIPFGRVIRQGDTALSFQAGRQTSDVIQVETFNAKMESIFNITSGENNSLLNITSVESAQQMLDASMAAIRKLTEMRAANGAKQEQIIIAQSSIGSAVLSQQNARGILADTDMTTEPTQYALEYVKMNAGISMLSQVNQLQDELVATLLESKV